MMNGNGQQPPVVYDGRAEVAVKLNVATWNQILAVIAETPWKIADPLMTEIRNQITSTLNAQGATPGAELRPQ
jgi:hypothetical protein